ncbi:MAG: sugar transferase [Rubricoccaceae bacterium]
METITLPSDRSYRRRVALASHGTSTYARRLGVNVSALVLAESFALALAVGLAGVLRQWIVGGDSWVVGAGWAVIPLYVAGAAMARLLPGWGLGVVEELRRVTLVLAGVFVLTLAGMWLANTNAAGGDTASRLTLGLSSLLAFGLVPFARSRVKSSLIRRDRWGVEVVIYGAGQAGSKLVRQLQEERGLGYIPSAVFDDNDRRWGDYLDTVPILGGTENVAPDASVAFLAIPGVNAQRQAELLEGPLACYRTVVVLPDLVDAPSLWVRARDFAGILGLEVASTLTRPIPKALKRLIDLVVVIGIAPFWLPVMGVSAFAVWLGDRESPFYAQTRIGQGGTTFGALKMRTMVPNAEAVLKKALEDNPDLRQEWDLTFKLENDPRITRIGAFLRRTSLDEIPQLINVFRGEMSLVGPRPLPGYHHEELPSRVRELRERVRPGITGLWQVSGRSDSGNVGMERWDPYYVRNWSLWLDVVILVRTFRVVFKGSGAY